MSSASLCWSYRATAPASGPKVGEKTSSNPRPMIVSSESFCSVAVRRLNSCKRRPQTQAASTAVSETKRRKIDGKGHRDITQVDGWNKTYRLSRDELWLHSSVVNHRSDHLLPSTVMKVIYPDSSGTAEVTTPLTIITGETGENIQGQNIQGTGEKSRKFQITNVREEPLSNVPECHNQSIPVDNMHGDVKIQIDETRVSDKPGLDACKGNSSVLLYSTDDTFCDDASSTCVNNLGKSYTDSLHRRDFLGTSQHNTAKDHTFGDTAENKKLGHVNSKRVRHGSHDLEYGNGRKLKLEPASGFRLWVDRNLNIVCISEHVWRHLGYQQMDMLGHSMEEYIHPSDRPMVRRLLRVSQTFTTDEKNVLPEWITQRLVLRVAMRSCPREKSASVQNNHGYTVVEWNFRLNFKKGPRGFLLNRLFALCRPTASAFLLASHLAGNMFISRHDLNFRFTFCDHRLVSLTGYEPAELIGWTPYHFISPWDASVFKQSLQALMCQGSSISRSYRFLTKAGVWVGMVTQATLVSDTRCTPRYINCKNHIVSDERIQQKLNKEKEEFLKMKCLSLYLKDNLPAIKQKNSKQSSVTNNHSQITLSPDLFKKTSFDSDQQIQFVNPWSSSEMQQKMIASPGPDTKTSVNSCEPFLSMALDSIQNVSQETIDHHTFTNKLSPSSESESIQFGEGIHIQYVDDLTESMNSICEEDLLNARVDSCQDLTPQPVLPQENTVNTMGFHQVFDYSDPVDQCSLTDTIAEPSWIQMEASQLGDIQMADSDSVSSHQRCADKEYTDRIYADRISQRVNRPTEDNKQSELSIEAFSALKPAQASVGLHDLRLPQTSLMLCGFPKENILSPSADDYQNITKSKCHTCGHQQKKTPSNKLSSTLASLLQKKPVPTSSSVYSLKEDIVKHASELFQHENKALSDAYLQSGVYTGNCQSSNSRTVISGTDIPPDSIGCAQQISFANNISSAISKLPVPDHNCMSPSFIRVSTPDTCQSDSNMLYSRTPDSENPSPCAFRELPFSDSENNLHNYCSIMTNSKHDPFLNQTSVKDFNPIICMDLADDVSSLKCSGKAHNITPQTSMVEQDKQSDLQIDEINHSDFSGCSDLFVSSSSISNAQFVSECFGAASLTSQRIEELDRFLGNTSSPCTLATNCNRTENCQAELIDEGFDSQVAPDTSPSCGSNDSSGSENLVPSSLLRTLLDTEGKSVHGPLTYSEWIFEEAMKKHSNIKTRKVSYLTTESKHIDNRRAKNSRRMYRKSVNLPLPVSFHGVKINFSKSNLPYRKPTKELPLPVSTKTTTQHLPSPSQANNNNESFPQTNNGLNNIRIENNDQNSREASNDFDLPDDLLDMAIDYCASMETDKEDALIKDLTDSLLSEEHFNSLCGSPSQGLKPVQSSNTHKSGEPSLSLPCSTPCLSKEGNSETSTSTNMQMHIVESQCSKLPESAPSLKFESSRSYINTVSSLGTTQSSRASPDTGGCKMSLLRTAVMTPDVDKLIKHVPRGSSSKYSVNNHDVLLPKCIKLREHSTLPSAKTSPGKVCQMPPFNAIKPRETVSLFNLRKHDYNPRNASDHKATLDYIHKTTLSKDSVNRGQKLTNCLTSAASNGFPIQKSGSSPFVLNIRIHQGCSPKVIISNRRNDNNTKQRLGHITSQTAASAAEWSVTDSSSTQPVSVIVMRKENNRTRRSKSIAVQTDNEPGEKYPEFEHSPSDTFLYPSVIVCSPSSIASEKCDISSATACYLPPVSGSQLSPTSSESSTASTSQPSPVNMSELERCLCGHLSDGSSSPREEGLGTLANASFLQRLLMGQLSKDQYQQLDKQMMESEKRVAISSGVL